MLVDPEVSSKASFRYFLVERRKGNTQVSRQFAGIVRSFFSAVRADFHYAWPVPVEGKYSIYRYPFILCKSMVMSGFLAVLGDIYRLMLLDFALGRECDVATDSVLSPELFSQFLGEIDLEGRQNPRQSIFAKESAWGIGGSAVLERRIYEALRGKVFEAYRAMAGDPRCRYQEVCAGLNGHRLALKLAQNTTAEAEKDFWRKIEGMCDGAWRKTSELAGPSVPA